MINDEVIRAELLLRRHGVDLEWHNRLQRMLFFRRWARVFLQDRNILGWNYGDMTLNVDPQPKGQELIDELSEFLRFKISAAQFYRNREPIGSEIANFKIHHEYGSFDYVFSVAVLEALKENPVISTMSLLLDLRLEWREEYQMRKTRDGDLEFGLLPQLSG